MTKEENEQKNLEFLVNKSRLLLQAQHQSYTSASNKAAILISVAALFIPIAISFISSSSNEIIIRYLILLPIIVMILALIYLLNVLMSKNLQIGFNFDQFEDYIEEDHEKLLLFEIGANKECYLINKKVVDRKHTYYENAVKLFFTGTALIFILISLNLFIDNDKEKSNIPNELIIYDIDNNSLNIDSMSEDKTKTTKQKVRIPKVSPDKLVKMKNSMHVGEKKNKK